MVVVVLAGCGAGATAPTTGPAAADRAVPEGCGPVAYDDVRGRPPSYGPDALARFGNDHAMCAGLWLPGADRWLVPQGMAIADGLAYVAGFDGTQSGSHRLCTIESVDLDSGRLVARSYPVRGQVGPRDPTACRHGGGVLVDEHGVWLAETQRLWLLDPATLGVRRVWAVDEPVRGSFAVRGRHGELGLGRFRPGPVVRHVELVLRSEPASTVPARRHRGAQTKALSPVMARPTIRVLISRVPS